MVTNDEIAGFLGGLEGVVEATSYGRRAWKVGKRSLSWDRPFSKADLKRFGDVPVPTGPILAIAVDGLDEKDAILAAGLPGVFTIPHFDGFPAVLVQLDGAEADDVRELIASTWEAWTDGSIG
jgi:hypothetical protein